MDTFTIGAVLAVGSTGTVYRLLTTTGAIAGKNLIVPTISIDRINSEALVHTLVTGHPNVVTFYGIVTNQAHPTHCYLLTELCEWGSLHDRIRAMKSSTGAIRPGMALRWFKQVVAAVVHLHSRGFVHLDLKPDNFLFSDLETVKMIDFGTTRPIGATRRGYVGTVPYSAPEVDSQRGGREWTVTAANDVWSLGVILHAMVTGKYPRVRDEIVTLWRVPGSGVLWTQLATRCLQFDPARRITAPELLAALEIDTLWRAV